MPTKRSATRWHAPQIIGAPEVAAQPCTEENAAALSAAPIAEAAELAAEDAAPAVPADGASRKRSRVHEIFRKDGAHSFCQCQENVTGGRVCGKPIKNDAGTKPLWNHVESFHPRTYLQLGASGHDEIAYSASADRLASSSQLSVTVNVTYQQMVDALSCSPVQILSDAIDALLQAREQRQA